MKEKAEIVATGPAGLVYDEMERMLRWADEHPRNPEKFKEAALAAVVVSHEAAESMRYALPRKKDNKTIYIEGPSVRLAEVLAPLWGNLHIGTEVLEIGDRMVKARSVAWDLENNFKFYGSSQRSIVGKFGKRYPDELIQQTANAAASIAFREAVFKIVPRMYVNAIYEAARKHALGTGPIGERWQRALKYFTSNYQATPEQIAQLVGEQIKHGPTENELGVLQVLKEALREGSITWKDALAQTAEAAASGSSAPKTVDVPTQAEQELAGVTSGETTAVNDSRPEVKPTEGATVQAPKEIEDDKDDGGAYGPAVAPKAKPAKEEPKAAKKKRAAKKRPDLFS